MMRKVALPSTVGTRLILFMDNTTTRLHFHTSLPPLGKPFTNYSQLITMVAAKTRLLKGRCWDIGIALGKLAVN